jgi:hypothetical protein
MEATTLMLHILHLPTLRQETSLMTAVVTNEIGKHSIG